MNKFIFEGYYDNILQSFGWQQINIGVPLVVNVKMTLRNADMLLNMKEVFLQVNH